MEKNGVTVTLIIPRYENMFSTFYTLAVIQEASKAAIEMGVNLTVATSWKDHSSAGVLFADVIRNEKCIDRARKEKIPYILLNYYNKCSKDNCIGIDNEKASFEAVDYLIKSGHRKIATITGKLDAQAGIDRLAGYKKALRVNKISADKRYIVNGDWTRESGRSAMKKLLLLIDVPTAVFVAGDEMAIGAMGAAKESGFKVPNDLSFVGFDNIPEANLPRASLTTVEQPFADLAKLGIKHLIEIIKNKPRKPVRIILENTKLIKRSSVKELKK